MTRAFRFITRSNKPTLLVLALGALIFMLGASGCAQMSTTRPNTNASGQQDSHPCNMGVASAIGGVIGALAGKGKGHLVGAALGAGLGALACTAYNYHVRKLRTAEQVNADYQRRHGSLPSSSTVADYSTTLLPGDTVRAGSSVKMQSNITVVGADDGTPPKVSEELTLLSPDGKKLTTVTKQAQDIHSAGEYQTDFTFNLPKGIKNGRYTAQTRVLLDGKPVRSNETSMVVVS